MSEKTSSDSQSSQLGFQLEGDSISFNLEESVYSLDVIYGACYLFVERCFIFLSRLNTQVITVRLTARHPSSASELDQLAGEFLNELLAQSIRGRLSQSTARIREYYIAAALRAAASAPSIDDLLAELESEELAEDPLEIMVPWEEKYGSKAGDTGPKGEPESGGG